MTITGYYALALLSAALGLVVLLHMARSRVTLAPLFALGAVETILIWQFLKIGWWSELGASKFNAPLVALVPPLVVAAGLIYALDGTKAARAYILTLIAAAAASIAHSEFVRELGHYIPLPSYFLFSLQQQVSLAFAIVLASVVVAVFYEALRRYLMVPLAIGFGIGCGIATFLVSYSLLSYGLEMGGRNIHLEAPHYALVAVPAMLVGVAYAALAAYRNMLLPARPVAEVFSLWHAIEQEIHTVRQDFLEAHATIANLQALNERLEMERQLRDYQMQHSPLVIAELDAAGTVMRHNPAAAQLLADGGAMTNAPLERWLPGIGMILRSGSGASQILEVVLKGSPRFIQVTAMPIRLQQKLRGFSVIAEDVTSREQAKFRQRVAERVKGIQMTSKVISHDFSNLMLAIEGNLSHIRHALPPPLREELESSLLAILQAAARGREMLHQLGTRQPFQMPELRTEEAWPLVAEAVRLQMAAATAAGIALQPDIIPGGVAEIDPTQILRVLVNLIGNAIRATPPGGSITVSLRTEERGLVVKVADSGHGMTPEQLASAFEPGFSTKAAGQGGLGLAISYLIVDAHGGQLTLESELNRGTTATVWLPLADATRTTLKDLPVLVAITDDATRDDVVQVLLTVTDDLTEVTDPLELLAILEEDPQAWRLVVIGSDFTLPESAEAALAQACRIQVLTHGAGGKTGAEDVFVSSYTPACTAEEVEWVASLIRTGGQTGP